MKSITLSIFFVLFFITLTPEASYASVVRTAEDTDPQEATPDIRWFKDELRISPKYIEEQEGIFGMSWLHFLLMLFLIAFFIAALIVYYRHTNRTARILQQLLSKKE